MRVLITGGTGFIGSRLAFSLLDEGGFDVRILGLTHHPAEKENAETIHRKGGTVFDCSLLDRSSVREAVEGCEVVFHLAAAQHEANVPDSRFREVNVAGAEILLDSCVETGVRRVVYGSTIGVYGSRAGRIVTNDSPLQPTNIYGVTKREAEQTVQRYSDRIETAVIRISETYGPGDRRLLKLFRGIKKGRFFMIGSCKNLHHPIYVEDLLAGLRIAATHPRAVGATFVLAGERPITTREMVDTIASKLGVIPPRLRLPILPFVLLALLMEGTLKPLGIQPPLHRRRLDFFRTGFSFSNEPASRQIGFVPRVTFPEGIEATARWYQDAGLL